MENQPEIPTYTLQKEKTSLILKLFGVWESTKLHMVESKLTEDLKNTNQSIQLDFAEIKKLDTNAVILLQTTVGSNSVSLLNISQATKKLWDSTQSPLLIAELPSKTTIWTHIENIGKSVVGAYQLVRSMLSFFGWTLCSCKNLILNPSRIPFTSITYHMEQTGLRAIPIVALLSFLIGVVIAYMGLILLEIYNSQIMVVTLLEVGVLRELGIIITAIVVAGRSGSAFTAQIGSMKSNEEVAALQVMGISPAEVLVFPRVVALIITLPLLAFIADIMGLLGGMLITALTSNLTFAELTNYYVANASIHHFIAGLIKAPFFASCIALIGCYQGFQVTGSADSVGLMTTRSVVQSIFIIIVLDALFAILFIQVGL